MSDQPASVRAATYHAESRPWWPVAYALAIAGFACSVSDPEFTEAFTAVVIGKRYDSAIHIRRGNGKRWQVTVTPNYLRKAS